MSAEVETDAPPRSRRSRWWWLALVPVVAFAWLLASGIGKDPNALPSELVGRSAPSFSLPTLSGDGNVDLASLKGNVVVVNFWASWCAECRTEHPALLNAWDRYRDRGVVFVGVDFEDSATDAADYAREQGVDWPLATDPGSRAAIDYGVFGVPETFVLDGEGQIVAKRVGPVDYEWLTSTIEKALGGSAV